MDKYVFDTILQNTTFHDSYGIYVCIAIHIKNTCIPYNENINE